MSSAVKVWTADLLALSADGKSLGLDSEMMVVGIVSRNHSQHWHPCDQHPTERAAKPTLISSSADIAQQNRIRIARRLPQEIPTIGTENQGPNGRHVDCIVQSKTQYLTFGLQKERKKPSNCA